MRQFLVTNLYNMYNTGEMMQLKALRSHFAKDKFTIASIYSIISKSECNCLKIGYVGSQLPPSKPLLILKAVNLLLQAAMVKISLTKPKGIIKSYIDCDIIIDLGGDTFSDDVSSIYTLAHCFSLLPAIILGKEYIICSQSIGKFKTTITKKLARFILNRAKLITTREAESTRYIKEELKIKPEIIRQTVDLAYLVPVKKEKKIPNSVGIITASLSKKQTGITANDNINLLARLALFYNLAGKNVVLIPHVICPVASIGVTVNLDDRSIANKISRQTGVATIGKPEDVGKMSLVIGSRMHALISALINGVPVVALSYSHKFGTMNGNAKLINIKEAKDSISKIIKAGNEAIANNQPNIPYGLAGAKENITLIENTLQDIAKRQIGKVEKCYFGHSTLPKTRRLGASGGIVKSLLVTGLKTNCFLEVLTTDGITNKSDEIPQGSIYHYNKITETNGYHYNIGIVCLPCQVNKYRAMFYESTIIGLFCSHAIELKGVKFLVKCFGLKGDNIKYRYKHNGKTGLLIDGKTFIPQNDYWGRFFNFTFIPKQCLKCKDLTAEKADISIGDAHGHIEFGKGENIIIARTTAGTKLLQNAIESGLVRIEEVNLKDAVNTQKNYIKIKKGELTNKLKLYIILRSIGCYISEHRVFSPLLRLWVKVAIKKEVL